MLNAKKERETLNSVMPFLKLHGMQCSVKSHQKEGSVRLSNAGVFLPPPAHSHSEFSDLNGIE